ncbi:flagellin [Geoalkalibacter sp.]|uniref:flagellin n=1 Tax=Geoalkalibacter sp. TaxID=3041440 RepID=UPI00272DE76B|nr:flagellin [Geoalkalibacter sp.]
MPDTSIAEPVKILVDTTPKGDQAYIAFDRTPADTTALGIAGDALDPAAAARAALARLDGALALTSSYRGIYGAKMNALDQRTAIMEQGVLTHSAALTRIQDADIAQETSALTRSSIQREAATALLAQANQQPQLLLGLLK